VHCSSTSSTCPTWLNNKSCLLNLIKHVCSYLCISLAYTCAVQVSNRPSSAPRCAWATSPQLARPSSCSPSRQRSASAVAALSASMDSAIAGRTSGSVLGSSSTLSSTTRAPSGQAGGARYTSRNAASAARPGVCGTLIPQRCCSMEKLVVPAMDRFTLK
jgi:hypothetical protein